MSLEDLGNIGDFLGGIAVIASLIYLAFQIRQNTASVRAASSVALAESLSRSTEAFSLTSELARISVLMDADHDAWTAAEKLQWSMWMHTYIRRLETGFYQQARGLLDEDHWQTSERTLATTAARPAFRRWWSEFGGRFSDRFADYVNGVIQANEGE